MQRPRRRSVLLALPLVLLLAVTAALLWSSRRDSADRGAPGTVPATLAGATEADPRSIAVLPFSDLSAEGDQEYFGDGLAVELISRLSSVEGLRVVARTSAFQFRDSSPDLREIGARLGVAYVVEGTVRKAGDRLRITAQLAGTRDGYQLWSGTYERRLTDVFAVQDEIGREIAASLRARLETGAGSPPRPAPTGDIPAYEAYLKGLHFLNRLQIPLAIESFESAIARDPGFARAYSALAEAHAVPAGFGTAPPRDSRARGLAAAETALRIDPSLAEAHAALGWLEMIGFQWARAEQALTRAVALDPGSARARFYLSVLLHRQGRLVDAVEEVRRAQALDPLSLPINSLLGSFLGDLGREDEAIAHLRSTLELDPGFPIANTMLGHIHMGAGRMDEAIGAYTRAAEAAPGPIYAAFLAHAHARAGRTNDARRVLDELRLRAARGQYVSPGAIGWIHLGLGELEEGFAWMERAVEERDALFVVYGVLSNRFLAAPYRDDPRFADLRVEVGLPR